MVARSVHSRPQIPQGIWGFVLLALFALTTCDQKSADSTGETDAAPLGLRLEIEGLAALEAAVLIRPAVDDARVVGPLSSLLGQALQNCRANLTELRPGKILGLSLWAEEGKLASSFDAQETEALKRCLDAQLDGQSFDSLKPGKRSLDLQLRLAPAKQK